MARGPKPSLRCCLVLLLSAAAAAELERPDAEALLRQAAQPEVAKWVAEESLRHLAQKSVKCSSLLVSLDWVLERLMSHYERLRDEAHRWQDLLVVQAYEGQDAHSFFRSPAYHAMLSPAMALHRLCSNTMEFVQVLFLLHGERCFHAELRQTLAPAAVALTEMSAAAHRVELAAIHHGFFAFWDISTDVYRHMMPIWKVVHEGAAFAAAMGQARVHLSGLRHENGTLKLEQAGVVRWQDEGGAFSKMQFMIRRLTNGWHLDHGLLASLLRLWAPPADYNGSGCHTTVADFGAGSGHYCSFFNKTEEICCLAFDGIPNVAELSQGKVQTQRLDEDFDLGRTFDWVLCLEVAEHVPRAAEPSVLGNLRRHASRGLVLSWSEHPGDAHPNSRTWPEARAAIESVGFALDAAASATMTPRVPWMQGAVRVFRTA